MLAVQAREAFTFTGPPPKHVCSPTGTVRQQHWETLVCGHSQPAWLAVECSICTRLHSRTSLRHLQVFGTTLSGITAACSGTALHEGNHLQQPPSVGQHPASTYAWQQQLLAGLPTDKAEQVCRQPLHFDKASEIHDRERQPFGNLLTAHHLHVVLTFSACRS